MRFIQTPLKVSIEFIIEIFRFIIFFVSSLFLSYFIVINVLVGMFPDFNLGRYDFSIAPGDLFRIFLIIFFFFIAVVLIDLKRYKTRRGVLFALPKSEIAIYFLCAFFFSYFFAVNIISGFNIERKFLLSISLLLSIPVSILLRQIIEFYNGFDFLYFKRLTFAVKDSILSVKIQTKPLKKEDWSKILLHIIRSITALFLFIFFVTLIIALSTFALNQYLAYKKYLRESFVITSVKPKSVVAAEKVVLEGYNFGWRLGKKDRLMSNFGEVIEVDFWSNTKIIFTVPLNWKEGRVALWVEREKNYDTGKIGLLKSKPVSVTTLSRWEFYPSEDDFKPQGYILRIIKKLKRELLLEGGWLYQFR